MRGRRFPGRGRVLSAWFHGHGGWSGPVCLVGFGVLVALGAHETVDDLSGLPRLPVWGLCPGTLAMCAPTMAVSRVDLGQFAARWLRLVRGRLCWLGFILGLTALASGMSAQAIGVPTIVPLCLGLTSVSLGATVVLGHWALAIGLGVDVFTFVASARVNWFHVAHPSSRAWAIIGLTSLVCAVAYVAKGSTVPPSVAEA